MKRQGTGGRPVSTAYYNQGLDLATRPYMGRSLRDAVMLGLACAFVRDDRRWEQATGRPAVTTLTKTALDRKHEDQFTPFGTRIADLVRSDRLGILASKCGECGELIGIKGGLLCDCHRMVPQDNDTDDVRQRTWRG